MVNVGAAVATRRVVSRVGDGEGRARDRWTWWPSAAAARLALEQQQGAAPKILVAWREVVRGRWTASARLAVTGPSPAVDAAVARWTCSGCKLGCTSMHASIASLTRARVSPAARSRPRAGDTPAPPAAPATAPRGARQPRRSTIRLGDADFLIGGFLDATAIVRSTNVGSGPATTFATIPLGNTPQGHLHETRFSSQTSRLNLLVTTKVGSAAVKASVEIDFLGNGPANAFVYRELARAAAPPRAGRSTAAASSTSPAARHGPC